MQYTKLGKSDLRVSQLSLGCMGFGNPLTGQHSWTLGEAESGEIIHTALEAGINFFDTAIGYQNGTSEEYLGRALKKHAKRDDVVIATKFLPRTAEEIKGGISAKKHLRKSLESSLQRLGSPYIDLYIYHMWDYNTDIREIMYALNAFIKEGKVRSIGISNCYAYQLAKANAFAEAERMKGFVSVQNHYNLIFREEEREMALLAKEDGIAMTPYSPLASGRLSRKPQESTKRFTEDKYAHSKYDKTAADDECIIRRVLEIAESRNTSMTAVSLSWLISKGAIPIAGATKESHIDALVKASELSLTAEETTYQEEAYTPHELVGVMAENKNRNQII